MVQTPRPHPVIGARPIARIAGVLAVLGVGGALALASRVWVPAPHSAAQTFAGATWATVGGATAPVVTSMRSGGEAAHAGLRVGDAIAAVDGHPDPTLTSLAAEAESRAGQTIDLRVRRGRDVVDVSLLDGGPTGDQDGRPHIADRGR